MAAEQIIFERVVAVTKAGLALEHLTTIRASTLPGTELADACDMAIAKVERVIGALYAPDRVAA
jgi:hypothetical protein